MPLTINGEEIDPGLIDAEFGRIKAHFEQQANVSCCERDDEFLGYAKENLSSRVLLSQHAAATIDRPEDEAIEARLGELKEEYGGEESFYFRLGISPGEEDNVRDEIAASLSVDRLVDQIAGPPSEIDDAAVQTYYDEHAADFMSAEEVSAIHIFKSLREAEHREDIFNELREVRKKATAGTDFMDLVRAHSDKPEEEADLGYFKRGELMDEFELIAFSMEIDEISPVFSTQWGLHLAKLTERKDPQPKPVKDVADDIRKRIHTEEREEKLNAHIEELRKKATIIDTTDDDDED